MKSIIKHLIFITIAILLISCQSRETDVTTYIKSNYQPINPYSNQAKHYVMIDGNHYFDLNVLSDDGTMDKIADNIPYGNPFNANIYGIATDGEYLYCLAWNLQIDENLVDHRNSGLYKIDVNTKTVEPLHEWETPKYISNNYSIAFADDYLYFTKSIGETNEVFRIKTDGLDFEQLTNNNEGLPYMGIFLIDTSVFYVQNGNLYKTMFGDFNNSSVIYENLYAVELYNGYFYITITAGNENTELIRIKADNPNSIEMVIGDMCADFYIIKNDVIYYVKYDPVVLITNSWGLQTTNPSQGQIYKYDINTGDNVKFSQNSEICYNRLYNISDNSIIARANPNTQMIDSAEGGGVYIEYYIIPLDGSEAYLIQDLTLALAGT